jgi:histone deacetylase 1/2
LGCEYRRVEQHYEVRPLYGYIKTLLSEAGLAQCKPQRTPFVMSKDTRLKSKLLDEEEHAAYRRLIGKLMWLIHVRPDMAFAIKELARDSAKPTECSLVRLKRCLRYLSGTASYCLHLGNGLFDVSGEGSALLSVNSDSSWASTPDGRSTTGGAIIWHGMLLYTCSKTQSVVSLSSAEAELIALAATVSEAQYVRALLGEIGEEVKIRIVSDSTSALAIVKRRGVGRVRHLDIRSLFLQDMFRAGVLKVLYTPGTENIADLFTKALPIARFTSLVTQLGISAETEELCSINMLSEMCSTIKQFGLRVKQFVSSFWHELQRVQDVDFPVTRDPYQLAFELQWISYVCLLDERDAELFCLGVGEQTDASL